MLNFGTDFENTGIFVNSFIKYNIMLRQKKLLTIKIIWVSEKKFKNVSGICKKISK